MVAGTPPAETTATLAVACQNISTDPGGRLTLHELTDNLAALQFPVQTARLYAAFGFVRSEPGILIANRVEVANDAGHVLGAYDFPDVVFPADQPFQRVVAALTGVIWPAPGTYLIRFSSRGVVPASFPVLALQVVMPNMPGVAPTAQATTPQSIPTSG